MALIESTKFIERVRFFDNERLVASDLQEIDDFARQMRWLHNRSLHQPGVASGYAVGGEKGDRQVTIQPGYAIDSLGREIVLTQPYSVSVPPDAGDGEGGAVTYDLTVSYPAQLDEVESRTADCKSALPGVVRLAEAPVFCWVAVHTPDPLRKEIESGQRLVLARVQVLNCQLYQRISVSERRDARPSVHPFIYATAASPAWKVNEEWKFGIELVPDPGQTIDTTAAGFRTTPCYFANLTDSTISLDGKEVRLEVFVSVTNPKPSGFEVALQIPDLVLTSADIPNGKVKEILMQTPPAWTIEWMGVEA